MSLLAGDKFMPGIHLKQPGFTYSACQPFTKNKGRIEIFKETGDTNYIYKNEFDKAYFQNAMVYEDFKDLARGIASDKVFRDEAFIIAKNPKYEGYQRGLAAIGVFFNKKSASLTDKSSAGRRVNMHVNNKIKQNQRPIDLATQKLAEELHKPIIEKLKKEQFILDSKTIFGVLI